MPMQNVHGLQHLILERIRLGMAPHYVSGEAFRVDGPLDLARLRASIELVVARHAEWRQADAVPLAVTVDVCDERAHVGRWTTAELRRLLDRSPGPTVRFTLIREGDARHFLVAAASAEVCDRWSLALLLSHVAARYADKDLQGTDSSPEPVPPCEASLDKWRELLAPVRPAAFRPNAPQGNGHAECSFRIDLQLSSELTDVSVRLGSSRAMLLMAAHAAVVARCAGEAQVAIANPRPTALPASKSIGCHYNVLPVPLSAGSEQDLWTLVEHVRSRVLECEEVAGVLMPHLALDRVDPRHGWRERVQHGFMMWHPDESALRFPGCRVTRVARRHGREELELLLVVEEGIEGLRGLYSYDPVVVQGPTVRRLGEAYLDVLRAMVGRACVTLGDLPLGNGEAAPRDGERSTKRREETIMSRFDRWCESAPRSTAIECDGASWSYGDLHALSHGILRELRRVCLAEHPAVAVALGTGPLLAAACMAVWRLGGAVIPMTRDVNESALGALRPSLLVTDSSRASKVAGIGVGVFVVSDGDAAPAGEESVMAGPGLNDPALLVPSPAVSSGAYVVSHGKLMSALACVAERMNLGQRPSVLQLLTPTVPRFEVAELLLGLANGAVTRIGCDVARDAGAAEPAVLWGDRDGWWGRLRAHGSAHLRGTECVSTNGWSTATVDELSRGHNRCWNVEGAGPHEFWTLMTPVAVDGANASSMLVGDLRAHVLDFAGRDLPTGLVGELHVEVELPSTPYEKRPSPWARMLSRGLTEHTGAELLRTGMRAAGSSDGSFARVEDIRGSGEPSPGPALGDQLWRGMGTNPDSPSTERSHARTAG